MTATETSDRSKFERAIVLGRYLPTLRKHYNELCSEPYNTKDTNKLKLIETGIALALFDMFALHPDWKAQSKKKQKRVNFTKCESDDCFTEWAAPDSKTHARKTEKEEIVKQDNKSDEESENYTEEKFQTPMKYKIDPDPQQQRVNFIDSESASYSERAAFDTKTHAREIENEETVKQDDKSDEESGSDTKFFFQIPTKCKMDPDLQKQTTEEVDESDDWETFEDSGMGCFGLKKKNIGLQGGQQIRLRFYDKGGQKPYDRTRNCVFPYVYTTLKAMLETKKVNDLLFVLIKPKSLTEYLREQLSTYIEETREDIRLLRQKIPRNLALQQLNKDENYAAGIKLTAFRHYHASRIVEQGLYELTKEIESRTEKLFIEAAVFLNHKSQRNPAGDPQNTKKFYIDPRIASAWEKKCHMVVEKACKLPSNCQWGTVEVERLARGQTFRFLHDDE